MTIAIRLSPRAYLPEATAYLSFLESRGIACRLVEHDGSIAADETAILFSGPDQVDRRIEAHRRIHEYHSLSTGSFRWLKDIAKTLLTPRPDGLIIQEGLSLDLLARRLPRNVPWLTRQMGIDQAIFDVARDHDRSPRHDLVYCGSIGRAGFEKPLAALARQGFRIVCYGHVPDTFPRRDLERLDVTFGGRIARAEIPAALASARAGLNWMPNEYPLNVQESTKTIEYVAAGLPTLSNRYPWAKQFAAQREAGVAWLDTVASPDDLDRLPTPSLDLSNRAWPTLLEAVSFEQFIRDIATR